MRLRLLGALEVWSDDVMLQVRGPREQKIVGMLMLHADRLVSIERLVEAVWDNRPPATAAAQIRNRVSGLRRNWAGTLAHPDRVLVTHSNGYLLRREGHQFDLADFERDVLAAQTAAAARDADAAARLFRAALAHWRGPALAGIEGRVLAVAAAQLEERRLAVTEECIGHELTLGRHHHLVAELTSLADVYPFRERLTGYLMLALYRSGRQADALACYERCARRLRDDLGLDPGDGLRVLHEGILRRSPDVDAPTVHDGRSATAPHGETPLPDADPVSDVVIDESPKGLIGTTVLVRPAELPGDVVDFTGRADQLASLDALLAEAAGLARGVPIIAVTGTAGVGKTALAVHWAHRVADRFPDGQLLLNLQGHAQGPPMRPVDALATMLRALGVAPDRVPADLEEASRQSRSLLSGKRMLLVLDNAVNAEQVRPLLPGSAGCLVLITSRDRLVGLVASHGARRLTVEPLAMDEAIQLLARILRTDRLRDEPEAVERLVEACASLPLALRIAAANLDAQPQRSIAGYTTELYDGDRLAALRIDGDSHAVRAVFDASYSALPVSTRRVFRLLGLAPGPDIGTEAMSALAGVDPPRAALLVERLAAVHLVQRNASGRCTAHDLLRLYARQRAEEEDSETERRDAVSTLLTWYLDHARAAAFRLHPHMLRLSDMEFGPPVSRFDDHTAALAWLDLERANLVAAVGHAAAHHSHHRTAWLLADTLRGYFWLRGNVVDWLHTANVALRAAEDEGDLRGQTAAQVTLAFARFSQGQYPESVRHYRSALELSRRSGWEEGQAAALGNIAMAKVSMGELRQALECLKPAVAINRRLRQQLSLATTLSTLGHVHVCLGDVRGGLSHLEEARALYQTARSVSGQAMVLGSIAKALHLLGRSVEAVRHCQEALETYRCNGDHDGEVSTLALLARIYTDIGQPETALAHATLSLGAIKRTERRRRAATVYNALGHIHLALGNPDEAMTQYEQALAAIEAAGSQIDVIEAHAGLAAVLHALGRDEPALRQAGQALAMARQAEYRVVEGEILTVTASIHNALGNSEMASARAREALEIFDRCGHRAGTERATVVLRGISGNVRGLTAAQADGRATMRQGNRGSPRPMAKACLVTRPGLRRGPECD